MDYSAELSLSLSQGKRVAMSVGTRLGIVKLLEKAVEPSYALLSSRTVSCW